ncbi:hypothetical protein SDC9_167406 [bioreactor metagenome]|uniref:Uncharacterized protein n=1 Tax=bioreactor metagenome TaxID=1076179 RepID=A0A645G2A4_9ZZZZ
MHMRQRIRFGIRGAFPVGQGGIVFGKPRQWQIMAWGVRGKRRVKGPRRLVGQVSYAPTPAARGALHGLQHLRHIRKRARLVHAQRRAKLLAQAGGASVVRVGEIDEGGQHEGANYSMSSHGGVQRVLLIDSPQL